MESTIQFFCVKLAFSGFCQVKLNMFRQFNGKLYPNLIFFSVCLCFFGYGGAWSTLAITLVEDGSSLKRIMRLPNFAYSMVSIFIWLDLLIVDWISEIIFYLIGTRPMFFGPLRHYVIVTDFEWYGLLLRMDARLGILICCWIGKWLLNKFYKEAMTRFE